MCSSVLPREKLGECLSSDENYNDAISSFKAAINANPLPAYYWAKARAHYYLGNKPVAVTAANKAIALDHTFTREAQYDAVMVLQTEFRIHYTTELLLMIFSHYQL